MKLIVQKPDTFGAIASILCVIHCVLTPLLFIVHSCSINDCDGAPTWWKNLDYFFLAISFFAVYNSTQTTSKKIMIPILWISWIVLLVLILNEKLKWFILPEIITYLAAFILAGLHIYNLNYCQCKKDKCCTKNG